MDTKLTLVNGEEQTVTVDTNRIRGLISDDVVPKRPPDPPTVVEIHYIENSGFTISKYAPVRRCGMIIFENYTHGKVSIQFPAHGVLGGDVLELMAVSEAGSSKKIVVDENAPVGEHIYSAFCHQGMQFAVGNSMPIIIINPKDER